MAENEIGNADRSLGRALQVVCLGFFVIGGIVGCVVGLCLGRPDNQASSDDLPAELTDLAAIGRLLPGQDAGVPLGRLGRDLAVRDVLGTTRHAPDLVTVWACVGRTGFSVYEKPEDCFAWWKDKGWASVEYPEHGILALAYRREKLDGGGFLWHLQGVRVAQWRQRSSMPPGKK